MFRHYLIIAFRNLMRNKFQSLFTIVGLAVAFFCFGFFAYFVHAYATWDEYYEKHDRVIQLLNTKSGDESESGITDDQIQKLQQRFPEVEAVFRYVDESVLFEATDSRFLKQMNVIECDTSLQYIYEPTLLAGDWVSAKTADYSIVLCQSTAIQLYGSVEEAIGQQLYSTQYRQRDRTLGWEERYHETNLLGQEKIYTIRAVVEDLPYNSSLSSNKTFNAWIFNGWLKDLEQKDQALANKHLYLSDVFNTRILLQEGTDITDFCQRLEEANIAHQDTYNIGERLISSTLDGYHLKAHRILFAKNPIIKWIGLMIILLPGAVILLSALSNFFHLLLSNILLRRREYTLRRAHGAHTFDLWCMVSTQIIVSLLLVGACTLVIVKIGAKWFQIGDFIPNTEVMLEHTCQHIGLLLVLGLLIAWMAVVRVRKDSLQESMQTSTGQKPKRHLVRHLLLGWQLTVGYFFLATLMALVWQIKEKDNSYLPQLSDAEKEEIITLPFNISAGTNYDMTVINEWRDALKAIPSIKDFSFEEPILRNISFNMVRINDSPDTISTHYESFSRIRAEMLKISLLEGEWPKNYNEVVVDRNFAEKHPVSIGDRLTLCVGYDGGTYVISGIIDNYLAQKSGPLFSYATDCYYQTGSDNYTFGRFTCRSYPGQADQMRKDLQKLIHDKVDMAKRMALPLPSLLDDIKGCNELYCFSTIINILAGIAMCLALLGIYSSIATDCATRRKEMAIRKINGAKAHHIALRFCRTYGLLLAISMLIAIPILYILLSYAKENIGHLITIFNYGPLFWLSTAAVMISLIAIATGWQVWRIARIQPAEVIKSE